MQPNNSEEFVTIVGRRIEDVMATSRHLGLTERNFIIVNRVATHTFALADGGTGGLLFDGEAMAAATFVRNAATPAGQTGREDGCRSHQQFRIQEEE